MAILLTCWFFSKLKKYSPMTTAKKNWTIKKIWDKVNPPFLLNGSMCAPLSFYKESFYKSVIRKLSLKLIYGKVLFLENLYK